MNFIVNFFYYYYFIRCGKACFCRERQMLTELLSSLPRLDPIGACASPPRRWIIPPSPQAKIVKYVTMCIESNFCLIFLYLGLTAIGLSTKFETTHLLLATCN